MPATDLPVEFEPLLQTARDASENAYAPYSRFVVGAGVQDLSGRVYPGCNVENGVFGLTDCAERNALSGAVARGARPGTLRRLLVYTPTSKPCPPCGACRQAIVELMTPDAEILSVDESGAWILWTKQALLPDAFSFRDERSP